MQKGDWVSYDYRDNRGTLRVITGKVVSTSGSTTTFRSDGGQRGFPAGKRVMVPSGALRLSDSPFAPHLHKNPTSPLSFTWKPCSVRRLPSGKVQVKITRGRGR
jgi:hypothetical protein